MNKIFEHIIEANGWDKYSKIKAFTDNLRYPFATYEKDGEGGA